MTPKITKRSFLAALLGNRCPRCRSGKMYRHSAYDLKRFILMHEHCPVCGLKYEIEPGFFWGAMYVTYAFIVALFLTTFGAYFFIPHRPSFWYYCIFFMFMTVGLLPPLTRLSRSCMLSLFGQVAYNPDAARKADN